VVPPKEPRRAKSWNWEKSEFEFPSRAPSRRPWIRLPDRVLRRENHSEGATLLSGAVYFPYVPAKNSLSADVNLCFPRRGIVRQESFGLATSFPFSFLRKTRYLALSREITVFPPVEATDELLELLPVITGEFEAFVRGRGYDLYRIRQYAPEDSARHVDWKASAKTGNLLVREFTREDERRLRVVFDNPAPGGISEAAYERAVALAASLGWHFAGRATQLSFVAPGYAGSSDIYEFLRYLAVVQPGKQNSVLSNLPLSDDYNLIFTSRPRGSIPTSLWARSYFLFMQDEGKPAAMPDKLSAPLAT
jgi:hypothetical protein